ncbi:O-antigen translocase [Edaphobacter acidisoli]|uniref:O-antigen translocase n=1 Tax=Edaphobacter acidisoli TaxID=2040573 RepID=A0A916RJQ9_9BACT|nr:O-antigen translocase [Edaphobacter acidisoli]
MTTVSCETDLHLAPPCTEAELCQVEEEKQGSYGQILKSSAMVGGSSAINIVIGMVRTKAMAILLGPAGFGLFGLFGSIANLTQTIAGMGVNSSGVRQIAEASGTGNSVRVAQTTIVLRRVSVLLGLLGAVLLIVFQRPVARLTFGSAEHAPEVALLSVAVFFTLVSAGQGALIQGMRRIADLAKMSVLGPLFGTIAGIVLVYFFRDRGVVPALIAVAVMAAAASWWYSRRIKIEKPSLTAMYVTQEVGALLKLGFAFMSSGLMTIGAAYAVRIMVLHRYGLTDTGLYQSAWTLGGLYVGVILQAMAADFYPRLTASANNNPECNRLVNEQAHVGVLLAGPGVIATLTIAPLIIALFYSSKFGAAVGILRWICLGTMIQVISWPMGFIIVAKARQVIFFSCELAWTVVSLALAWICLEHFGIDGAGIAFFGSYIFHAVMIYTVVSWLSGFRWSTGTARACVLFLTIVGVVFAGFHLLPFMWASVAGVAAAILSGIYSVRALLHLVPAGSVPVRVRKIFVLLRMAPAIF